MTTALREHLAAELAKKVSQRGVVVWQDTDHEYGDVAATLCPPDARFAAYGGSWYALRRDVESARAAQKRRLVLRVPKRVRRKLRRALARRKRVTVTVRATARDAAGNVGSARRVVRLTR